MHVVIIALFPFFLPEVLSDSYYIIINGDNSVVLGGSAIFDAQLYDNSGPITTGSYDFVWRDNAMPQHNLNHSHAPGKSQWKVTYEKERYAPGPYNIEVDVYTRSWILWHPLIASQRTALNVTFFLSGDIALYQKNVTAKQDYVASNNTVLLNINLPPSDKRYLNETQKSVASYWFVDCQYFGPTNGLNFTGKFDDPETNHYIEALVVASDITNKSQSLNATTTETNGTALELWLRGFSKNETTQGFCLNSSIIPLDIDGTYGYYQKKFTVKAPVKVTKINGSNWLQDGEILNMSVSCNGSGPYNYCIQIFHGLYNVTGNENCSTEFPLRNCTISLRHLFLDSAQYTILVIISNVVSHVVTPIGVNIYKVTKQPQLSIIVVPVAFSLVAVVLIIFGIAYWYQSRRSLPVETADFDFANQTNDMEYKSFRERLQESIANSFFKSHEIDGEDNVWSPRKKYGSMQ